MGDDGGQRGYGRHVINLRYSYDLCKKNTRAGDGGRKRVGEPPRRALRRARRNTREMAKKAMARIHSMTVHRRSVPLVRPFVTAVRAAYEVDAVLVEVRDSEGRSGWGEAPTSWRV